MARKPLSTLVLACMLLAASAAVADELTFISDRDNTLYEPEPKEGGGLAGLGQEGIPQSNGAGEHFFAGVRAGQLPPAIRRGLIHFDVSSIPPGSSIEGVELTLSMSRAAGGPSPVSLHRATADWGEGTSDASGAEGQGADATPGDATWFHTFFETDFWTTEGGDFSPTASATISIDDVGLYTWTTTAGLEADVSAWVDDPGMNFGWVVVGQEGPLEGQEATAKRFDSREFLGEGSLLPRLTVIFTPPVPVELQSFDID